MTSSITKGTKRRNQLLLVAAGVAVLGMAGFTAKAAFTSTGGQRYIDSQQSLGILRSAFGADAETPIREGRVVVVPTSAATTALSDDVNIRNRAYNSRTGRMWAPGDTAQTWPLGIRGFTDVATGDVYINAEFAMETTTPHELLHANASPAFANSVGLSLYEGTTEQLALDALRSAGLSLPTLPEYPTERALVAEVVRIAGPQLLTRAYFNGGTALEELVKAIGPETLAKVKGKAAVGDLGTALAVLQTVGRAG